MGPIIEGVLFTALVLIIIHISNVLWRSYYKSQRLKDFETIIGLYKRGDVSAEDLNKLAERGIPVNEILRNSEKK